MLYSSRSIIWESCSTVHRHPSDVHPPVSGVLFKE